MLSPVVQSLSSMTETSHLRDSSSSSKSGDYLSKYLHMHTQTQTPHTACIQPGTVLAQMSANQNYAIPLSCATMQLQPKGILHSRQEEFFRPSHQDHISEPCLITFNMFHKYVYTWAKTGKKRGINNWYRNEAQRLKKGQWASMVVYWVLVIQMTKTVNKPRATPRFCPMPRLLHCIQERALQHHCCSSVAL